MNNRPLTTVEQDCAVALLPLARAVAHRWGRDDEWESEAIVATCEAIVRFNPDWGISLQTYIWRKANLACYRLSQARSRAKTNADLSDILAERESPALSDVIPDSLSGIAALRAKGLSDRECASRLCIPHKRAKRMLRDLEECLS
jgi:hypothetical protein